MKFLWNAFLLAQFTETNIRQQNDNDSGHVWRMPGGGGWVRVPGAIQDDLQPGKDQNNADDGVDFDGGSSRHDFDSCVTALGDPGRPCDAKIISG